MPFQKRKIFDFLSGYAISEYPDMHFIVDISDSRALCALFLVASFPYYKLVMDEEFSGTRFFTSDYGQEVVQNTGACLFEAGITLRRYIDTDLRNIENKHNSKTLCIIGLNVPIETIHEAGSRYKSVMYIAPPAWIKEHKIFAIPGNVVLMPMDDDTSFIINSVREALYGEAVFRGHIILNRVLSRSGPDITKEAFMKYIKDGPPAYFRDNGEGEEDSGFLYGDGDILNMMESKHGGVLQRASEKVSISESGIFLDKLTRSCFQEGEREMTRIIENIKSVVINKERFTNPSH